MILSQMNTHLKENWTQPYNIYQNKSQLDKRLDFKNQNNKNLAKRNLKYYLYYLKEDKILTKTENPNAITKKDKRINKSRDK